MNPALMAVLLSRPPFTLSAVIAALFASGDGAIYEFGDLASIYQDSAGRTAGAVGQAAGLALDERYGLVRGGTNLVSNGDFSSGTTGWTAGPTADTTASVVSGSLRVTQGTVDDNGRVTQPITCVVGNSYELIATVTGMTAATAQVAISNGITGTSAVAFANTNTPATLRLVFVATNTTHYVRLMINVATNSVSVDFDNISVRELPGNHASQSVAASRPVETAYGAYTGALFDGTDDSLASPTSGGSTTGFFWCGAVRVVGGDGTARSIWSDVGTNTGYRVRIASTNKLALGAGDGAAYTSATTTDDVLAGNTYVLTVWDDGANLNAQVNRGTVASVARPSVSAGSSGFSIGKDHNASSAFANIAIFAQVYRKNGGVSDKDRLRAQRYCASEAGISI